MRDGILLVLLLVCTGTALAEFASPVRVRPDNPAPERVLFVGNSYLYYNDSLHNHVGRILAEIAPEIKTSYKSVTISGARLAHHDLGRLLKPGRLGIDAPFQLVILQGGSFEPLSEASRKQFDNDVKKMAGAVRSRGGEPALYMTHAYVDPHPKTDPAMFPKIYQTYVTAGNRHDALVIPVGLSFERAYKARPGIRLHKFFDGTHPSMLGTYLAACVVVAAVYNLSPIGVQYNAHGEVAPEDAGFLQRVAVDTVEAFYGKALR